MTGLGFDVIAWLLDLLGKAAIVAGVRPGLPHDARIEDVRIDSGRVLIVWSVP